MPWSDGELLDAGDEIVVRDVQAGRVLFAWPMRVVADDARALIAAQVPGAVGKVLRGYRSDSDVFRDELRSSTPLRVDFTWTSTVTLLALQPEQWWATRLMWDAASGDLLCTYVDLLRPPVRRGTKIDTSDLALDLVVLPDGSYVWKDEDQIPLIRDLGWLQPDEWLAFEAARHEILDALEAEKFPFDGSLLDLKPDFASAPAALPLDWDI